MKLVPLFSMLGVVLLFPSCIEGPEIEEDPFNRIPDANIAYVIFGAPQPSDWLQSPYPDSASYADFLLDFYGETRTIAIRMESITGPNRIIIEVPTITSNPRADCEEILGTIQLLPERQWYFIDLEADDLSIFPEVVADVEISHRNRVCYEVRLDYPDF